MEEEKAVKSTLLALPAAAVCDLLSIGVCPRCIFRIFGVRGDVYSSCVLSIASLSSWLKPSVNLMELPKFEENIGSMKVKDSCHSIEEKKSREETCIVCLGVLQILCVDQKELTTCKVKINNMFEAAVAILETLQSEGHQFNSFCLEVSIPPVVLIRDRALWLYIKEKYGSENWFKDVAVTDCLSVKDALKLSLTKSLEDLLGKNSDTNSSFRIALIYKHTEASLELDFVHGSKENNLKRRKTGENTGIHNGNLGAIDAARTTANAGESFAAVQRTLNSMSEDDFAKKYECPPKKLYEPCQITSLCYRTSIYIGGRYLKYSRNVSQTCWMIDDERMGEASVEEIIGNAILPYLRGDRYKFHAAGREDIDVRMLGSGRPFLVEVLNARVIPTNADIMELETKINNSKDGINR